jgi:hypothetical protein
VTYYRWNGPQPYKAMREYRANKRKEAEARNAHYRLVKERIANLPDFEIELDLQKAYQEQEYADDNVDWAYQEQEYADDNVD